MINDDTSNRCLRQTWPKWQPAKLTSILNFIGCHFRQGLTYTPVYLKTFFRLKTLTNGSFKQGLREQFLRPHFGGR